LSGKELSRAEVMGRVKAGHLRLGEASELLELSYRQAKRIWARYRGGGAKALQHGNCGRRSNRAYAEEFRTRVLEQVRHRYAEFGPTLAAEHLASDDGLTVQVESLNRNIGNRLEPTLRHVPGRKLAACASSVTKGRSTATREEGTSKLTQGNEIGNVA